MKLLEPQRLRKVQWWEYAERFLFGCVISAGAAIGFAVGLASARYVQTLLYEVKPTDPRMIAVPWLVLISVTLLATVPAAVRAIRTDPAATLRTE